MMKKNFDIDLYFQTLKEDRDRKAIEWVEQLVKHQFPDIQNLEVTMTSVKYADERYSLEEVSEFVKTLYKP